MAVIATMVSCAKFDYESILEQLCDHESRIQKLETLCNQLNSNIEAVQTIIQAQNSRDYVTDIVKIMENGVEVGYSITFAQSGTVTIYHGSDGADGAAPKIGIRKASDGEYYWTSDDEWMTDDQVRKCGVRIPGSNDRIAPDYIIIARGCKDWSHGKGTLITDGYFDNPETWTYPMTDEVGTYYGIKEAISLTVKNMREAYPKAKIYLCTITMNNRGSKNTFPPCYGGKSMVSFNRAIRECAEFFGCGLLDLASCGVTYENLKTYAPDGTHLNAAGHKLAGERAIVDFGSQEVIK